MKRFIISLVIAIAIICGYLTPAYAGGSPITAKITVTTPAPNPTPTPSVTTPAPNPVPHEKTPSAQSTETAETPKPSETKLAKTGTDISFVVLVTTLIFVFGSFLYLGSRKDD